MQNIGFTGVTMTFGNPVYNSPEGNVVARLSGCQARHTYTLCVQVGHLTTISSLSIEGGTPSHAVIGELC